MFDWPNPSVMFMLIELPLCNKKVVSMASTNNPTMHCIFATLHLSASKISIYCSLYTKLTSVYNIYKVAKELQSGAVCLSFLQVETLMTSFTICRQKPATKVGNDVKARNDSKGPLN